MNQAGGLSVYGTMGQAGNAIEWLESPAYDEYTVSGYRQANGGLWGSDYSGITSPSGGITFPDNNYGQIGFRIAARIPEPSTISLVLALSAIDILRRCLSHTVVATGLIAALATRGRLTIRAAGYNQPCTLARS